MERPRLFDPEAPIGPPAQPLEPASPTTAPHFAPVGQRMAHAGVRRDVSKARNWILGVGILQFVFDMVLAMMAGLTGALLLSTVAFSGVIFAFFIAMWLWAKRNPTKGFLGALIGFWTIHIIVALITGPASILQGVIIKIAFTAILWQGYQSAKRTAALDALESAKVFQ